MAMAPSRLEPTTLRSISPQWLFLASFCRLSKRPGIVVVWCNHPKFRLVSSSCHFMVRYDSDLDIGLFQSKHTGPTARLTALCYRACFSWRSLSNSFCISAVTRTTAASGSSLEPRTSWSSSSGRSSRPRRHWTFATTTGFFGKLGSRSRVSFRRCFEFFSRCKNLPRLKRFRRETERN